MWTAHKPQLLEAWFIFLSPVLPSARGVEPGSGDPRDKKGCLSCHSPVLDLSLLNEFLIQISFRMDTAAVARQNMRHTHWSVSVDLKTHSSTSRYPGTGSAFQTHQEKSEFQPKQKCVYLGIEFNTVALSVKPPPERIASLTPMLVTLSTCQTASARQLASTLGKVHKHAFRGISPRASHAHAHQTTELFTRSVPTVARPSLRQPDRAHIAPSA